LNTEGHDTETMNNHLSARKAAKASSLALSSWCNRSTARTL
jgi:hypothetical protein